MARYLQFDDVTTWVTMEGSSRAVFLIERPRANTITCWIASESGKKFAVNWRNPMRPFALQGKVIIDGVTCDQHIMLDSSYQDRANAVGVSFARTSQYTQRDFMFTAIEVTDDDSYLDTINQSYNFGTISLELWRLHVQDVVSKPIEHQNGRPVLESQVVHERSKKAGTHHVKYSEEYYSPPPVVDVVSAQTIDEEPYVTFTFKYRPMAMLMANGIVPRPPRANSAGQRTQAEAAEEIRQLEGKLKALRAKAGARSQPTGSPNRCSPIKKVKREIKKEPSVSRWPRHGTWNTLEVIDLTLD